MVVRILCQQARRRKLEIQAVVALADHDEAVKTWTSSSSSGGPRDSCRSPNPQLCPCPAARPVEPKAGLAHPGLPPTPSPSRTGNA